MKKIIIMVLVGMMLFTTGAIAIADDDQNQNTETTQSIDRSQIKSKLQELKQNLTEYKPLLEEVRKNSLDVKALTLEIRQKSVEVKKKVSEIRKNDSQIDEETLMNIKAQLDKINADRKEIAATIGDIHTEVLKMRDNRRDKNYEAIKENMNNILATQESRLEDLNKLNADMDALLRILE